MARVLETDDEATISLAARSSFRNFGKYVIDFIHFLDSTPEEVRRRIVFDDELDRINAVMAEKKGVIFITLHYGNWDMGAAGLSAYGFPVNVIAETFPHPAMNALVQGSRRHLGMKVTPMEKVGPSVIRALHQRRDTGAPHRRAGAGRHRARQLLRRADGSAGRAGSPRPPQRRPPDAGRRMARQGTREELIRPIIDFDLPFREVRRRGGRRPPADAGNHDLPGAPDSHRPDPVVHLPRHVEPQPQGGAGRRRRSPTSPERRRPHVQVPCPALLLQGS